MVDEGDGWMDAFDPNGIHCAPPPVQQGSFTSLLDHPVDLCLLGCSKQTSYLIFTTRTSRGGAEAHPQPSIDRSATSSWTSGGCVKRLAGGVLVCAVLGVWESGSLGKKGSELRRGQGGRRRRRRAGGCGCGCGCGFGLLFGLGCCCFQALPGWGPRRRPSVCK